MKNLMVFVDPAKSFLRYFERLCRVQIETAQMMGWKNEDIILATNFDFEHKGVKSMIVPDHLYCPVRKRATKCFVIDYLISNGILKELCWFHDFDAHQLQPLNEMELEIGDKDIAIIDYGWCLTCSFFFKPSSIDMIKTDCYLVNKYRISEESAFNVMKRRNYCNINERVLSLNISYGIGMKTPELFEKTLSYAIKPLKVIHANPRTQIFDGFKPFMSKELLNILSSQGFN